MAETDIRVLEALDDLRAAAALWEEVWDEPRVVSVELLRAMTAHGSPVLGAFEGGEMVGAQMAFLGMSEGDPILHSHVTGVRAPRRHAGVGTALKWAQRDWALAHGIETVTWTFDPMIARNAHLNMRKLGARAERFFRDFYGEMRDAFNTGERSDRLEIVWRLRDPRVEAAARGDPGPAAEGAAAIVRSEDGRPVAAEADADRIAVQVPAEYLELRGRDADLARAWRDAVAEALEGALARGYSAIDFTREGFYVLERT